MDFESIKVAFLDEHSSEIQKSPMVLGVACFLSGCGGSTDTSSSAIGSTQVSAVQAPSTSKIEAARFLAQATNGATSEDISRVANVGIRGWLNEQLGLPASQSAWDWLRTRMPDFSTQSNADWDRAVWRALITAPDQLRQRTALSLLDIFVVGVGELGDANRAFCMAGYWDILTRNAFGNFKDLLREITFSPAMGQFLTYIGSQKANEVGIRPDENYAREVMQLFTVGLYRLNSDGSFVRDSNGERVPTYIQQDVTELAKVFTGFTYPGDLSLPVYMRLNDPNWTSAKLAIDARFNETGPVTFLGHTISGGGEAAVNAAIQVLFDHPNTPPFISRLLIQRLTTSNPSPAYIARVSATFADNGSGIRGDMKAMVKAILLDPEARSPASSGPALFGKLRDPVQRFTNWARAFGATSKSGEWYIGDLSSQNTAIGQSPGRSRTVFNFFQPEFQPPESEMATANLVSPEFQITNESSVISYVNFMASAVYQGVATFGQWYGDVVADYSDLAEAAKDPQTLLDAITLRLGGTILAPVTTETIRQAIVGVPSSPTGDLTDRIKLAIFLVLSSPEFISQV